MTPKDTILIPDSLEARKIRATNFVHLKLNRFAFGDKDSYEYRTADSLSNDKIRKLAEAGLHLFPSVAP